GGDGALRRLHPALSRAGPLPRAHRALDRACRPRAREVGDVRRSRGGEAASRAVPLFADLHAGRPLGQARRGRPGRPAPASRHGPPRSGVRIMQAKWLDIGPITQIEPGMAATLPVEGGEEIAVFHTMRGEFYALVNKCPHKQGPLSQGIVHGDSVTCPLHSWKISLRSGEALGEDKGCVPTIPVKVDAGRIYLLREAVVPPVQATRAAA